MWFAHIYGGMIVRSRWCPFGEYGAAGWEVVVIEGVGARIGGWKAGVLFPRTWTCCLFSVRSRTD